MQGIQKTIIWCRDAKNNWKTEIEQDIPATFKQNFTLVVNNFTDIQYIRCSVYDPWTDKWIFDLPITEKKITIPDFLCSMVIVLEKNIVTVKDD